MTRIGSLVALMKRLEEISSCESPGTERVVSEDPSHRVDVWVREAQRGDRQALEKLLKHVLPSVRNLVRLLCGNDRNVDDFSQEVLMVLVQRIGTFEGRSSFSTWVHGVTVRVVRGRMRNQWFQRAIFKTSLDEQASQSSPQSVQTFEARRQVAFVLDQLPPKQREVVVMHHALEMTLPEISEALDINVETARSRLRLARKRLSRMEADDV